ncbi:MAG: membrane protein required for colicin V production [Roseivirga sp.]
MIKGFSRGFIREVAALTGLFVGVLFTYLLSEYVFQYFTIYFKSADFELKIISYVVVFFLTILLINALASMLTRVLKLVALSGINRILGAILGLGKWLVIVGVGIFILNRAQKNSPIFQKSTMNESKYFRIISEYGEEIASALNFDTLLDKQYLIKDAD